MNTALKDLNSLQTQQRYSYTDLDDFLHARGADHVGVRVEADLVHYGAVTLQDHEGPVHHSTRASLKGAQDVRQFDGTAADETHELRVTEINVLDKDSLKTNTSRVIPLASENTDEELQQ